MSHTEFRPQREPLVPPGGCQTHDRDMTATFSADLTLAAAQQRLADINQWLPIDGDPHTSLGQLISTNSTGPLRLGYGAWRDLLLGCQFINGQGQLITAGGRTVKNVAGYDLAKFMVGQHGIFGRLVSLTTRTYARPSSALLAIFDPHKVSINDLLPTPCRPQWAALVPGSLLCGYLADERTIDFYASALPAFAPAELNRSTPEKDAAQRRELWQLASRSGSFRASVPPAAILQFTQAAGLQDWVADAAFGIVIGRATDPPRLRQAATELGGSVYFIDHNHPTCPIHPSLRPLLERLKAAFDPDAALTPLPNP